MDNSQQCSSKKKNKRRKIAFTPEEDQQISFYVNLFGTKKWSLIANYVKGRTAKQCRDRYMNNLKPGLSTIEWTQNEDDLLLELHNRYGPKWSIINKHFSNRSQISLKNRMIFLQKHENSRNNLIDQNRTICNLAIFPRKNNDKKINGTKYLLPNVIPDPKCDDGNVHNNISNNHSEKEMETQKEDSFFGFENEFEYSDELSSFSIFIGENDLNF